MVIGVLVTGYWSVLPSRDDLLLVNGLLVTGLFYRPVMICYWLMGYWSVLPSFDDRCSKINIVFPTNNQ